MSIYTNHKNEKFLPKECICQCNMNLNDLVLSIENLGIFSEPSIISCPKCQTKHEVSYTHYYGTDSIFRFDKQKF